jgi:hypothetical protein
MKPRGPTATIKATPISKSFKSPSKLMVSQDSITPVSLPGSPLDVGDTFILSFVLIHPAGYYLGLSARDHSDVLERAQCARDCCSTSYLFGESHFIFIASFLSAQMTVLAHLTSALQAGVEVDLSRAEIPRTKVEVCSLFFLILCASTIVGYHRCCASVWRTVSLRADEACIRANASACRLLRLLSRTFDFSSYDS